MYIVLPETLYWSRFLVNSEGGNTDRYIGSCSSIQGRDFLLNSTFWRPGNR